LFALPVVVPLIALGIVVLTGDPIAAATRLVDPDVLALLLVVQAGLLGWRLLAVGSSVRAVELPSPRPVDRLVVALLVAIVVLPQAALADATAVAR
jgi:microcompartment protein CcmK/EutM